MTGQTRRCTVRPVELNTANTFGFHDQVWDFAFHDLTEPIPWYDIGQGTKVQDHTGPVREACTTGITYQPFIAPESCSSPGQENQKDVYQCQGTRVRPEHNTQVSFRCHGEKNCRVLVAITI